MSIVECRQDENSTLQPSLCAVRSELTTADRVLCAMLSPKVSSPARAADTEGSVRSVGRNLLEGLGRTRAESFART